MISEVEESEPNTFDSNTAIYWYKSTKTLCLGTERNLSAVTQDKTGTMQSLWFTGWVNCLLHLYGVWLTETADLWIIFNFLPEARYCAY